VKGSTRRKAVFSMAPISTQHDFRVSTRTKPYNPLVSALTELVNEVSFIGSHPHATGATLPRYLAWNVRCAFQRPAIVPLTGYGIELFCPPQRRGPAKLAYIFRDRYDDELAMVRRFVGLGDRAIDIGANIGIYTVVLASLVGPSGHVLAVEAASANISVLQRSIALNDFDNVTVVHTAVSNREGTVKFGLHSDPGRSSLVAETDRFESVGLTRLDSLVLARPVRFVKIDIEGAEPLAFLGAEIILSGDRPTIQFESTPGADSAYGYEPGLLWH